MPVVSPTTPLSVASPGVRGRLALAPGLPRATALRLAHLGLRAGTDVTVLGRTSGGGRLVGTGTTRIGLDCRTCALLELLVDRPAA